MKKNYTSNFNNKNFNYESILNDSFCRIERRVLPAYRLNSEEDNLFPATLALAWP